MAFPADAPLGTTIQLSVGGVWTDITPYTYLTSPITITRGRADEATRVDYGRCTLVLNNKDGRFSPRNPMGPYYGLIGRNTPVRVSVQAGSSYLSCPGGTGGNTGASTPDAAPLDITGDIDVRVEATLDNWITAGVTPSVELAGKFNATGNQKSWLLQARDGGLHFEWSANGTATLQVESTAKLLIRPNRRLAVRAVLDVDNGSAGSTVTFYTAPSLSGPWTQLGNPIITAGVTSIFNSTAPLRVGRGSDLAFTNPLGAVLAAEVRNGIGGTVVASPDFRPLTPGATSFVDTAGRTWTVGSNASVSNERTRFVGEISNWPREWDTGGRDVRAPVEASGIIRRLRQGKSPLQSALRRRIPAYAPTAYWPMEEGSTATQTGSPIEGVPPLRVSGFTFAADATLPGSAPLPSIGPSASMSGGVPAGPATVTAWQVEMAYNLAAMPATVRTMLEIQTMGTIRRIGINVYPNQISVIGIDDTDTPQMLVNQTIVTQFSGQWNRLRVTAAQNGANIDFTLAWVIIGGGLATLTGSWPGTLGRVTSVGSPFGPASDGLNGMKLGHLAVFNAINTTVYDWGDIAWNGETAGTRLARLCAERGTGFSLFGAPAASERMGPQAQSAFLDLLEEASDADHGILYERRDSTALAYRDRISLYNQPVGLALDYTAKGNVAPPLKPVEDDQLIRNDRTVQRANGTIGRAVLRTGALSVQDPPNGIGQVDDSVTLNLYDDSQPDRHAGWLLLLGTWDEGRFPSVKVLLHRAPALIDDAASMDSGDILTIANPPAWEPPDTIRLMAQGYTEVLGVRTWEITFNCSPAGPWSSAAVTDDPVLGRVDTDGSALAWALSSTDTWVGVSTTAGPIWTADPAQTPWDIRVGGEVMTVNTVGSVLNSNAFFTTDASSWAASNSTIARSTAQVPPNGVASLLITPNGVAASGGANGVATGVGSVTAGADYRAMLWAYSPGGWSDLRPCIDWLDANGAYLSTGLGTAFVVPAGVWTLLQQTITAPAGASKASLRARHGGTPAAAATWYVWGARIVPVSSYATSPQTFTVVRSVNGIVKAQPSGTDVRLAQPAYVAL